MTVAHGQSLEDPPSLSTVSESESHVTVDVSGSVYYATVDVSGVSEACTPVHTLAYRGSKAHGGGGYKNGGSGGDGNAAGAVHLVRRSPAEGGDNEVSGDGDRVGMARSLSTSASGRNDMEVYGRIVILAPVIAMSVEGGGMMGSVPSGGEASSSICITTADPYHQRHIQMNRRHHHLHHLLRPLDDQPDHPLSHHPYTPLDPLLDPTQQHTLETQHSCSSSSYGVGGICGSSRPDSYVVPASPSSATTTDTTCGESGKKSGRTVTLTAEDMQKKKNDTFNILQVIIGQLQFMDVEVEQDDLNQKFLTSLALEWLMHTIVWRNRSDLDTMSLDDLYNHLKVYESEVKKKSEPNSRTCGNEDGNTACVPTASTNVPTANASVATISQDTACAYIASQSSGKFWKKTGKKISIHGSDVAGFDKSKDWSYMANDEEDHALVADEVAPTEFALNANTSAESKKLETLKEEKEGVDGKLAGLLIASKHLDNLIKSQRPSPTVESTSGDDQNRNPSIFETVASPIIPKPFIKFVKPKDSQSKSKTGPDFVMKKKACFNCGDFNHLAYDCRKRVKKSFTPKPIIHRPYRPSQGPVRTNMNGVRPNKTYFNEQHNMYSIDLNNIVPHRDLTYLVAKASADEWKQHTASCKSKLVNSVTTPLHTSHMDLFGPTSVSSISHKWYCLVVTDDFSRFTWTFFLKSKDETSGILKKFITKIENLKNKKVKIIRCDNRGEFKNNEMNDFCSQKGIKREFSNAMTPKQNGVAERRNRTLIEAARTMLADAKLPVTFWAEAVNTTCYVQNRVLVNKYHNKTPYELFNGRSTAIGFLKPFGCHVMILKTLDNLEKFEEKGDEGYFIGYSMSSKA
nr:hypothetical protein [Tanacetum cinerariifolium]